MGILRTVGVAVATPVLMMALASTASADGDWWKSSSDPLKVYEDDVAQGKAYGHFYDYGDGRAMSTAWYADMRPGGNAVRVETDFHWYGPGGTDCGLEGGVCWWFDTSKQTDETTSSSWQKHARARDLVPSADRARGAIDICEVQAWSNDPCSRHVLPTFDY